MLYLSRYTVIVGMKECTLLKIAVIIHALALRIHAFALSPRKRYGVYI